MLKVVRFRSTKGICESCPTLRTFLLDKEKLKQTQEVFSSICSPHRDDIFFHSNFFSETNFKIDQKVLGA